MSVQRIAGAIKYNSPLPWEWHTWKGAEHELACVSRRGRCATEEEAQQAADAALPFVLRAYDALAVAELVAAHEEEERARRQRDG